ncbi:MAG TPA: glycoside hydrolase family 44 protein [Verrucomicrobiae bacterium]|nr:glycoside hydrolase family 44 protein [Verrucomicrobiae bacterium]
MKEFFVRRRSFLSLMLISGISLAVRADQIIYDDALENGWQDWGWATHNYANTTPVHSGSDSISVTITNAWDGLQIVHSDVGDTTFTNISFWLNGGASGGQRLQVYGLLDANGMLNTAQNPRFSIGPLAANAWQQFNVPLSSLGVAGQNNFTGFVIQDALGQAQPTFYVDDIILQSGPPPAPSTNAIVAVQIDALANRHAISPLIYGVAFALSNQLADLNSPLNRSGGNNETRYNWQLNAHNLDADWYFESYPETDSTPGGAADDHIANSKAAGAQAMITIPMIGWSPKLGPGRSILYSYSVTNYGPQTSTDPYLPDAGNGISSATGLAITNNNPNDANFLTDSLFQQGYVQHLIGKWGSATNGGVRYYIMDNEHSLWSSTHQDVHPVGPTMQEIWSKLVDYAGMVKSNDPTALIVAPEEWGWPGYFYSGYDWQWAGQSNDYNPNHFPDRAVNGNWDYMPWLLNQFYQYETNAHQRLLDYFTLHCYPQEENVYSQTDVTTGTALLRNQSTRQFWDTNYVDPSWINSVIMLIPRMKNWVATYYPGTKIGITEYNWGAENYMNGATAQADILGIFGREGLDLATRWTTPASDTPTYKAMKMYRNYDGNKSMFGDISILATVPNPDNLAAFAAVRASDGAMTVMVINKDLNNATPVTLNLTNFSAAGTAQCWQLVTNNLMRIADLPFSNNVVNAMLPAQSIALFVLPPTSVFRLRLDSSLNGQFDFWLDGQSNQTYTLQSSMDLIHWQNVSTNVLSSNSLPFSISTTTGTNQFYRALWLH